MNEDLLQSYFDTIARPDRKERTNDVGNEFSSLTELWTGKLKPLTLCKKVVKTRCLRDNKLYNKRKIMTYKSIQVAKKSNRIDDISSHEFFASGLMYALV